MPTDPRKRQKKQERRAAKRKSKRHELARASQLGMAERMEAATRYPVWDSWVSSTLWSDGLGQVGLSRELPGNQVAYAIFLVDRYCLGAKNAMCGVMSQSEYESRLLRPTRTKFGMEKLTPADVRKLVEGAVEYARALGLAPHPDYQKAKHLFGNIDPAESREVFEYGKDGKPYFFAGPHDTPERCRQILRALENSRGPGQFHFTMPVPMHGGVPVLPEGMHPLPFNPEDEFDDEDEEEPE